MNVNALKLLLTLIDIHFKAAMGHWANCTPHFSFASSRCVAIVYVADLEMGADLPCGPADSIEGSRNSFERGYSPHQCIL